MAILYQYSEAEKSELKRLADEWQAAINAFKAASENLEKLTAFMTSTAMSNYNVHDRGGAMNVFQSQNTWFEWQKWIQPVPMANNNIDRTSYINYYANIVNSYADAVKNAETAYKAFKAILDKKELDFIAAQQDSIVSENNYNAAELEKETEKIKSENTKYIAGVILVIVIIIIAFKFIKK